MGRGKARQDVYNLLLLLLFVCSLYSPVECAQTKERKQPVVINLFLQVNSHMIFLAIQAL